MTKIVQVLAILCMVPMGTSILFGRPKIEIGGSICIGGLIIAAIYMILTGGK